MASVGHTQQQATVPRIVLPITSRGLVLTDRLCWGILAVAMAAYVILILYLNRGTTFNTDQMAVFLAGPGFGPSDVFEPVNGHLGAVTALTYQASLELFGADYLPLRILHVATVVLATGLFFALAKRRIGAVPALAPTLVLLFLGSDWGHVATPLGFTVIFSVAAGLAALVALERGDRTGEIAACALVAVSIATFSTGLAFLVGVAISVLLRPDRRRRAWIFLVPLALYAGWWLWSLSAANAADQNTTLSNLLLIPSYIADSLAAVTAALTGLDYDFTGPTPPELELGWGRVVAAVALVALGLRIKRGAVPPSLWVALGIVLTYWCLGALAASSIRPPGLDRYIYMGAVGVLLVTIAAATGSIRFSRAGLAALYVAAAFSIATNLAFMRDATAFSRDYSSQARAQFTMLELARGHVEPGFDPVVAVSGAAPVSIPAGPYLAAVDRYGSPGFSLPELERQPLAARGSADRVLANALDLHLERRPGGGPTGECERVRTDAPGAPIAIELPPGGASLRADGPAAADLTLGRFASSPSVELGRLAPGEAEMLRIPTDASLTRWSASVEGARAVEVCALG